MKNYLIKCKNCKGTGQVNCECGINLCSGKVECPKCKGYGEKLNKELEELKEKLQLIGKYK